TKVNIVCPEHGLFKQNPDKHLLGSGCPSCSKIINIENRKKTILENKFRGMEQPSDYKIIPLGDGMLTLVDNDVFEEIKHINWRCIGGYARHSKNGLLHRYIMNPKNDQEIDHINHNTLDNRKVNLRICLRSHNAKNTRPYVFSSSRFKGVSWDKGMNKWHAQITHNDTVHSLGYFDDELECALTYDEKAKELFKEFAYLNFKSEEEFDLVESLRNKNKELVEMLEELLKELRFHRFNYSTAICKAES